MSNQDPRSDETAEAVTSGICVVCTDQTCAVCDRCPACEGHLADCTRRPFSQPPFYRPAKWAP